jgi:hypothetical protein
MDNGLLAITGVTILRKLIIWDNDFTQLLNREPVSFYPFAFYRLAAHRSHPLQKVRGIERRNRPRESGNRTLETSNLSIKSINLGNASVSCEWPQCKENGSEIGAKATGWERRSVVDLIRPMIVQLQGTRMQISRSLSPRVDAGTDKGRDRDSATATKPETGKRLGKEEQDRGRNHRRRWRHRRFCFLLLESFWRWSVLFRTVVGDADGGRILLFDPQNEK